MTEPALRAHQLELARAASRFRLEVDSIELERGGVLAILGPNGAGKSTLLRCLAGLERRATGTVELTGAGAATLVFQAPAAFSGTVWHNVRAALYGSKLARSERDERIRASLERFEIAALADRRASTLSGGELRRLALARAFVLEPSVLLLDEPFDDLDSAGQAALSVDLRRVIAETGVAVAMVTHDLKRALLLADRLAVMEEGRIVQHGPRNALLHAPASVSIARLLGMSNLISGTLDRVDGEAWVRVGAEHRLPVETTLPTHLRVTAGIRPEDLRVDADREGTVSIGKGAVQRVIDDGVTEMLAIAWAGYTLEVTRLSGRLPSFVEGDSVSLSTPAACVHLIPEE